MTTSSNAAASPMGEMNTTPLIDVLLVLLIMFIMTIPVASHVTPVDLPRSCEPACPDLTLNPVSNKIVITASDTLLWNGKVVDGEQLAGVLARSLTLSTEPELQLEPSAQASYDRTLRTLDIIKQSGVSRFGFVGNERYRDFALAE